MSSFSRNRYAGGQTLKVPAFQTTYVKGGGGGSGSSAFAPQSADRTPETLQNLGGLLGFMYVNNKKDKEKQLAQAQATGESTTPTTVTKLEVPTIEDAKKLAPPTSPVGTSAAAHMMDAVANKTPVLVEREVEEPSFWDSGWFPWNWFSAGGLFGGK